jgi:hypothetical protein
MKKKLIIVLLMSLLLVACYDVKKPKKPSNLISKDKMVAVLVDMAIMSSAKGVNKRKLELNGVVPEAYIYERHNIDSTIFIESNAYYAFDIKTYDVIYTKVKDSLTVLRDKYKAIETKDRKEKEKVDSVKRAKIASEKNLKYKQDSTPKKAKPILKGQLNPLKSN